MRIAAVDVGSNTVHVLVCDVADGGLVEVGRYSEMPSLGAWVARHGSIGPEKGAEVLGALRRVLGLAAGHGYEHLVAGATQAVRRASDADEFLHQAGVVAGVPMQLITGVREAQLSFAGVASRHASREQWLMADLGGGSTELVVAHGHRILVARSLPIGSGVLADRHLSDPPRPGEREALRKEAVALLSQAPECEPERLVVTGGTATNLPAVLSLATPPTVLNTQALLTASERLDSAPAAELAEQLLARPARVLAMRGGVEVLLLLLDWVGLSHLHVSQEGLRQGMLLAYLAKGDDWYLND